MVCPDKEVRVCFRSIAMDDPAQQWLVHLTFPAQATEASVLPLFASDWDGVPIVKGTFECMGDRWPIVGGHGEMTGAAFMKGIRDKEKAIWFMRPGQKPVPGGLTFG